MPEYYLAQTYRSASGQRRITYRPDYCRERPWVAYYRGTAGLHFPDLDSAQRFHQSHGDPLDLTTHH